MQTPPIFRLVSLLAIFAFAAASGFAQESAAAPPVATPLPTASSNPSPATPAQAAPLPAAKPAKIWTNDEINTLRDDHGVSVVGKTPPKNASATSTKTKGYSLDKDPSWYRSQLQPLQADIAKLDDQIEKTKAFLNGEQVNDPPTSNRAFYHASGNPQEQLGKLEARRNKDEAKVNDLLDRARHNGVEPGDLR